MQLIDQRSRSQEQHMTCNLICIPIGPALAYIQEGKAGTKFKLCVLHFPPQYYHF